MLNGTKIEIPVKLKDQLGKLVRDTWINWAEHQPDPKPSWLTPWDELDQGQKEVDQLIGEAVAARVIDCCNAGLITAEYPMREKYVESQLKAREEVIKALNGTIGQLLHHVQQLIDASMKVIHCREELAQAALQVDSEEYTEAQQRMVAAMVRLKQAALTKQVVDMGPYKAVDFVRLGRHYIELMEAAHKAYEGWKKGLDIVGPLNNLWQVLESYPLPDMLPTPHGITRTFEVTTTEVRITQNVKELIAMLQPDTEVEAIVYETGKAVVTEVSAKLALLMQAVGHLLWNYPYQQAPGDPMEPYNTLAHVYGMLSRRILPKCAAADPVGWARQALNMIRWQGCILMDALETEVPCKTPHLRETMKTFSGLLDMLNKENPQPDECRRTKEEKGLQP